MTKEYGAPPEILYAASPVMVDNRSGQIVRGWIGYDALEPRGATLSFSEPGRNEIKSRGKHSRNPLCFFRATSLPSP